MKFQQTDPQRRINKGIPVAALLFGASAIALGALLFTPAAPVAAIALVKMATVATGSGLGAALIAQGIETIKNRTLRKDKTLARIALKKNIKQLHSLKENNSQELVTAVNEALQNSNNPKLKEVTVTADSELTIEQQIAQQLGADKIRTMGAADKAIQDLNTILENVIVKIQNPNVQRTKRPNLQRTFSSSQVTKIDTSKSQRVGLSRSASMPSLTTSKKPNPLQRSKSMGR